jgi:hypothetical protein
MALPTNGWNNYTLVTTPSLEALKEINVITSSYTAEWARNGGGVTQTFVSVDGPDNCWVRSQRQRLTGAVFPGLPMTVTRSDGVIRLDGSFFQVNYVGTYTGADLTASGIAPLTAGGGATCLDGTTVTQLAGASALTGTFSTDDQRATLTEVNSYRLATGELVTYTWDWQATRRP